MSTPEVPVSAAAPAAATTPGAIPCPRCGAEVGPDQDWCLVCGAPARTRLAPTPDWKGPVALLAVLAVLVGAALAVGFVELTKDPAAPQAAAPTPTPAAAPAATTPAATTAAAPPAVATTPTLPQASGATAPATSVPSAATVPLTSPAPSAGSTVPQLPPTATQPSGGVAVPPGG